MNTFPNDIIVMHAFDFPPSKSHCNLITNLGCTNLLLALLKVSTRVYVLLRLSVLGSLSEIVGFKKGVGVAEPPSGPATD